MRIKISFAANQQAPRACSRLGGIVPILKMIRRFSGRGVLLGVALLSQSCGMIVSSSQGIVPEMVSIPQPSIVKPSLAAKKSPESRQAVSVQTGQASWYGKALAGKPTASGEIFDHELLTAAHRSLPLGTRVRVTNIANGKSVIDGGKT
jgi:hypothetical protein